MPKNKRTLLIVAHGSRREASNDEVRQLAEVISAKAGIRFMLVEPAFLELATPSIPDGIENCIQPGA
jgi:sirohydrochlorin ferrochelatase